jgi:hypothetical protein
VSNRRWNLTLLIFPRVKRRFIAAAVLIEFVGVPAEMMAARCSGTLSGANVRRSKATERSAVGDKFPPQPREPIPCAARVAHSAGTAQSPIDRPYNFK